MSAPRERRPEAGDETSVYDVVIVGLGPSGAAAANACGQLGLRTLVIERDLAIFERQRAIALDDEALRAIGNLGLYDEVTAHMHLGVTARFIGLNGKPFITGPTGPTRYTGHAVANFFHQPFLESALREGLKRWPHVEVLAGWTAEFVDQNDEAVTLRVIDADGTHRVMKSRYVLACDGGSSPLRKQLGIEFAGKSYSEQWMDVQAQRLGARFLTVRPGTSVVADGELGDPAGQLWNTLTANATRFLVVRPDRYVYQATDDAANIALPPMHVPAPPYDITEPVSA